MGTAILTVFDKDDGTIGINLAFDPPLEDGKGTNAQVLGAMALRAVVDECDQTDEEG